MELAVHQDKILNSIEKFKAAEKSRATDAATTRGEIGKLTELTGVHPKAFAMIRQLDKAEVERREDILRSFDALRDILEASWNGQATRDMLDGPDDETEDTAPDDDHDADLDTEAAPDVDTIIADGGPELAADAEEFEAQADQVVTPINFGGSKG